MSADSIKSLKVLHIASGDLWAGAEVQLYNLVHELNKMENIDVHVILLNHGILEQRLLDKNIKLTVFDENRISALQILRKIRDYISIYKPNVVHTHRQKENILGSLAAKFKGNTASLRTVHGSSEFFYKPWQIQKQILKFANQICGELLQAYIVAVSKELAGSLESEYSQKKIRIVENGINVDEIEIMAKKPVDLPGNKGAIKVGLVGRLVPVKRVDLYLELAEHILNKYPELFEFYIFGDGPLNQKLLTLATSLGIEKNINWMGFQDDMPSWLKNMNLLLIMSDHEGLPMTLLEALALGVPVISHAVGGIPHVLRDGMFGTLIYSQEIESYANKLVEYLNNPEIYIRKAMDAKIFVRQNYSSKRTAEEYRNLYYEII